LKGVAVAATTAAALGAAELTAAGPAAAELGAAELGAAEPAAAELAAKVGATVAAAACVVGAGVGVDCDVEVLLWLEHPPNEKAASAKAIKRYAIIVPLPRRHSDPETVRA